MSDKPRALFELRPRLDGWGFSLTSESLPFGDLWYEDQELAIRHAKFFTRPGAACVVRVLTIKDELVETRIEDRFQAPEWESASSPFHTLLSAIFWANTIDDDYLRAICRS
jgi:hypothetical protein